VDIILSSGIGGMLFSIIVVLFPEDDGITGEEETIYYETP